MKVIVGALLGAVSTLVVLASVNTYQELSKPTGPGPIVTHEILRETDISFRVMVEMEEDPDGWSADRYNMKYRDGTEVWVANQEFGLTIIHDGIRNFGLLEESDEAKAFRKRLWPSVKRWQERRMLSNGLAS